MREVASQWGDRMLLSDQTVEDSSFDIVKAAMAELRASFDKCKVENNWPDDARPMWDIRWMYMTEGSDD